MLPSKVRRYVLIGLQATPIVMQALLLRFQSDDPIWDRRPDPERFTLREAIAHIADWDEIFLARMQRTQSEDTPTLPDMDEGQIAEQRNYTQQDPVANLRRFATNREALVAFLQGLGDGSWARAGLRPELGLMTIEDQALLALAHDGYHTKQAAEYLS